MPGAKPPTQLGAGPPTPMERVPRVIVKKAVDRHTLYAACRALCLGAVLISLGIAMSTIGFYASHFATTDVYNTSSQLYTTRVDREQQVMLKSLGYIGPVIMGVGAFLLMIACVMTLESRDRNTQIVHEYSSNNEASLTLPSNEGGKSLLKRHNLSLEDYHTAQSSDLVNAATNQCENADQVFDLPRGAFNRTFVRDDSKMTRLESDSSPLETSTTLVTYLTKSHRGSSKMGATDGKSHSMSNIDDLLFSADERVILQRFLEDQTELASRMRGRHQFQKQSMSLDVRSPVCVPTGSRASLPSGESNENIRFSTNSTINRTPGAKQRVVLAEIHYGDSTGSDGEVDFFQNEKNHAIAPLVHLETMEPFPSPMSLDSSNYNSPLNQDMTGHHVRDAAPSSSNSANSYHTARSCELSDRQAVGLDRTFELNEPQLPPSSFDTNFNPEGFWTPRQTFAPMNLLTTDTMTSNGNTCDEAGTSTTSLASAPSNTQDVPPIDLLTKKGDGRDL